MNILTRILAVGSGLLALVATFGNAASIKPNEIQFEKELLITDPGVVDSELARYPGPWSFGTLMAEMAGDDGRQMVREWLSTMEQERKVGGQSVKPRPNFTKLIIEPWQRRDGYDPKSPDPWLPKLENAPFRLLAIVNRMDLGAASFVDFSGAERLKWTHFGKEEMFQKLVNSSLDGIPLDNQPRPGKPARNGGVGVGVGGGYFGRAMRGVTNVGEGRLVFGAVDEKGHCLEGGWTLIFEYNLSFFKEPADGQEGAKPARAGRRITAEDERSALALRWAKRWHALGDLDLRDQRFVVALAEITRTFTHRSANSFPTLAQLRSNDGAFGPGREFRQYESGSRSLELSLLPGTPAPAFMEKNSHEGRALGAFLSEQTPLIRAGIGNLPPSLRAFNKTYPVQTAIAIIPEAEPDFHWDLAAPRETRRLFSLSTCNGCHAGETACLDGLHVHPREVGQAARLSAWLGAGSGGLRVADPATHGGAVDLREMQDRKEIFAALLNPRETSRLRELRETLRDRLSRSH